jgi:FMN-dependent dehydrogenase
MPGLDEMMVSFDFEPVFFANVPLVIYDYTAHGDGSEFTVRRNRQAFDWVDLVPGRVVDRKTVDLSTEVLGTRMKYPIIVAPSAVQGPLHPDGEVGMHRGATGASNTPMVLSQITSIAIDKVAAAATGPLWAQLYPQRTAPQAGGSWRKRRAPAVRRSWSPSISRRRITNASRRIAISAAARARRPRRGRAASRHWAGSVSRVHCTAVVHVDIPRRDSQDCQGAAARAAAREGDPHRRGRETLPRARDGRHYRLQPRWPLDGLRPFDSRSAAADRVLARDAVVRHP